MRKVVIVGSSGHAKVVIDIVRREERFEIVGLLDDARPPGAETLGLAVLGALHELPNHIENHSVYGVIIAIGDNFQRRRVVQRLSESCPNVVFPTLVHPAANVAPDVEVGEGTIIVAGATLNPGSKVGRFCILNTNCSLDHDSSLGDFASLAPHAATGGNCSIGPHSAVGIGATILNGIEVGEHTVVGAGALVLTPLPPGVVAYGSTARIIRKRSPDERYL